MNHKITEQTFYKYIKCPSWIVREKEREEDLRDALLEKLQDDGLLREAEVKLIADRPYIEVVAEDIDEASQKTAELMKEGTQTIYKGVLVHGHWVGRPDVLERVEGSSKLGDYYYIACDIKRSRHMKDEYKFQGAFYALILEQLQGVAPVQGYVLHANGKVEGYLHEDFSTRFHLTLDEIENTLENGDTHFLTSGCKQSPYFSECEEDSKKCDDLSLLNRIWRSEVDLIEKSGIKTLTGLANASVQDLKKISGLSMDRLYFLQQQAISIVDNKIIKVGKLELPDEDGIVLVVDIESDPLRDLDYLFGVLVIKNEKETYHSFLAEDKEGEEKAWKSFTKFLEKYPDSNIYHYGWYEVDVFRKMTEKYGAPEIVKNIFEHQMINVLDYMRDKLIFPISFYSLKDIAKHIGFKWRIEDASGLDSVLWYEEWLNSGNKKTLQDIVDYNEDDVRATWLVRNWALDQYGDK